jgi:hypothetical protein
MEKNSVWYLAGICLIGVVIGIIFVGAGFHIHDKVRGTLCINITTGKVRCWIIR